MGGKQGTVKDFSSEKQGTVKNFSSEKQGTVKDFSSENRGAVDSSLRVMLRIIIVATLCVSVARGMKPRVAGRAIPVPVDPAPTDWELQIGQEINVESKDHYTVKPDTYTFFYDGEYKKRDERFIAAYGGYEIASAQLFFKVGENGPHYWLEVLATKGRECVLMALHLDMRQGDVNVQRKLRGFMPL